VAELPGPSVLVQKLPPFTLGDWQTVERLGMLHVTVGAPLPDGLICAGRLYAFYKATQANTVLPGFLPWPVADTRFLLMLAYVQHDRHPYHMHASAVLAADIQLWLHAKASLSLRNMFSSLHCELCRRQRFRWQSVNAGNKNATTLRWLSKAI